MVFLGMGTGEVSALIGVPVSAPVGSFVVFAT